MSKSWDNYWGQMENRRYWLDPDNSVVELVRNLDRSAVRDALDLGCGIGRHGLFLAKQGFRVVAVDSSSSALSQLRQNTAGTGVSISIIQGNYLDDLFQPGSFDLILAFNVIYHGDRSSMQESMNLSRRWLRLGGLLFFTCPTQRDAKYGSGELVDPDAYRSLNSVHPGDIHYFASEDALNGLLSRFDIIKKDVEEHNWDNKGVRQFSSYWRVLVKKRLQT